MISLAPYRKAIAAAVTTLGGLITTAALDGAITGGEWYGIVGGVLIAAAAVYQIPNTPDQAATPDRPVSVAVKDAAGEQVGTVVVPGAGVDVQQPTSTPEPDLSRLDRLDGLGRQE